MMFLAETVATVRPARARAKRSFVVGGLRSGTRQVERVQSVIGTDLIHEFLPYGKNCNRRFVAPAPGHEPRFAGGSSWFSRRFRRFGSRSGLHPTLVLAEK
jgi:hypothetical protein